MAQADKKRQTINVRRGVDRAKEQIRVPVGVCAEPVPTGSMVPH